MSFDYVAYWNSLWGYAPAGGAVTYVNSNNATYTAPPSATVSTVVDNGNNDQVVDNAATLLVIDNGNHDTTTTSSGNIMYVSQGASDVLTLTGSGQNVLLDLTNADGGASNATTLNANSDTATLVNSYYTCNSWYDCSVPWLNVNGDSNKIRLGNYSTFLGVNGVTNIVVGGSASSTVNLGVNSVADVILGGCGAMTVASTGQATNVIGGSGSMCLSITGDYATVVGGSGSLNATITGAYAAIQTGSGSSCITLTGPGAIVSTGSGSSVINYSDATGVGGLFYEARTSGYAEFNVAASNSSIYGGDVIRACGTDITIKSQAAALTDQGGSILSELQGLASTVYAALLPDADIQAALQAANPVFLPAGVSAVPVSQQQQWCCGPQVCQPSYKSIDFRVNSGGIFSDSRMQYATVNGSNNSLYGGTVGQVYWIQSGEFNVYYAGAGNNVVWGDFGRNMLEYINTPGSVTVNLACGYAINGYGGTDTLYGINWAEAGSNATLIGGQQSATLTVYGDHSSLQGGCGNDVLTAFGSNNTLSAGNGADLLHTTGVNNSYVVGAAGSIPSATIINQEAAGVTGTLSFLACAQPSQLWFKTDAAGDLVIDVLGTTKTVTVDNWFATGNQLTSISAGGKTIGNAQINALETAMVNYQATHASFDPTRASSLPSDSAIQSAYAGWH